MKHHGRKMMLGIIIGIMLSFTAFQLTLSQAEENSNQTNLRQESWSYQPNEIIVKLKKTIAAEIQTRLGDDLTIIGNGTGVASLDQLGQQFHVQEISPVFAALHLQMRASGKSAAMIRLEKLHQFAQRAQRAPRATTIPDLENIYLFSTAAGVDIPKMVQAYRQNPLVAYAEPNFIAKVQTIPNDPYYTSSGSWGQSFKDLWGHYQIKVEQAWNTTSGAGVIAAVVDTGIDYTHPDIVANLWSNSDEIAGNGIDDDNNGYIDDVRGYDFASYDNDPKDGHGHGTHVAGTIAASGNNGLGIIGLAYQAKIMPIKGLDDNGSGSDTSLAGALSYAADNGADVINNSWAGIGDSQLIRDAVEYAYSLGCVVMAAAGNDNTDAISYFPANIDHAITVAATDPVDNRCTFSNYGSKVDVAAPGGSEYNILSLLAKDSLFALNYSAYVVGANYIRLAGTSMACPHVVGLTALILSANPQFSIEQVRQVLKQSADQAGVDIPMPDHYIGTGRINAAKALQMKNVAKATLALISPFGGSVVSGLIDIAGTATATNFANYSLFFGEGIYPSSWQKICTSTTPVTFGLLCSGFDTTKFSKDAENSIKLEVMDTNGLIALDSIVVIAHNGPTVAAPLNNDIFRAGDTISIKGTLGARTWLSYKIEYGQGENPTSWSNQGISLPNGGQPPLTGDLLGTWDSSMITQAGFYSLRLTVSTADQQFETLITNIFLDPTLKNGWPQQIAWEEDTTPYSQANVTLLADVYALVPRQGQANHDPRTLLTATRATLAEAISGRNPEAMATYMIWGGMLEPMAADINNDGLKEIIVNQGGCPAKIQVFTPEGLPLSGWPVSVGTGCIAGGNLHLPLVGDLNNDGYGEIIAYNMNEDNLYAFAHDGSLLPGWPLTLTKEYQPTLLMADIDLDGKKEIIFKGNSAYPGERKIVIISSQGTILSQWQIPDIGWGASLVSSPVVGNFDDDPELEIVMVGPSSRAGFDPNTNDWINEGIIAVYNQDGSLVNGWPVMTPGPIFSSPAVGDINKDGKDEIVAGLMYAGNAPDYRYGGLFAYDRTGQVLTGWPALKGWNFFSAPALADFDGNGDLEVVASMLGFQTYVLHHDGTTAVGWPQMTNWNDYYSPVIADVNGDTKPDIITTAGNGIPPYYGGVYAWNYDGSTIAGFPKVTESDAQAPAMISDIDQDGQIELLASSDWDLDMVAQQYKLRGTVYIWDIAADVAATSMHWPAFHRDLYHSGDYSHYPETPIVSDEGDTTNTLRSLGASWISFDIGLGAEHHYRITENSPDGRVVRDWTSVGADTSVVAEGLNLRDGQVYYFGVKSLSGAGIWSAIGYSDGITAQQSAGRPCAKPTIVSATPTSQLSNLLLLLPLLFFLGAGRGRAMVRKG
jgi:hypothetical protein